MNDSRVALTERHSPLRLGYGAMQLAGPGVFGPPRDKDAALAVLRRAIELGIDHIDTSQYYGPNVVNELIHEALCPYPEELVIVTKLGARRGSAREWLPFNEPEQLRTGLQDNLRTLALERIDVANLRVMDSDAGEGFVAQVRAMHALCEEGLLGAVGLSNVTLEQLDVALEHAPDIVCVQNMFNIADRSLTPMLERCQELGIVFVPFFPLGSGVPGQNAVLDAEAVVATAQRLSTTTSQVALAWLLALAPNIALIPGTSSVAHLEENHAAGELTLDAEALAALDAVPQHVITLH